MAMEAPEIKKTSLSEQGKQYIAQLDKDAESFYTEEMKWKRKFSERIDELFEKHKKNK